METGFRQSVDTGAAGCDCEKDAQCGLEPLGRRLREIIRNGIRWHCGSLSVLHRLHCMDRDDVGLRIEHTGDFHCQSRVLLDELLII